MYIGHDFLFRGIALENGTEFNDLVTIGSYHETGHNTNHGRCQETARVRTCIGFVIGMNNAHHVLKFLSPSTSRKPIQMFRFFQNANICHYFLGINQTTNVSCGKNRIQTRMVAGWIKEELQRFGLDGHLCLVTKPFSYIFLLIRGLMKVVKL